MLTKREINDIALNYNCFIDFFDRIYHILNGDKVLLGKIYYKESTEYYHAINILEVRYEGNKNFEALLIMFLKGEKVI